MAVRIAGVDLPVEKKVDSGLTAIYGIGRKNVQGVLETAAVDANKRIKDLTAEEITRLQKTVEKIPTEGELRTIVNENIKQLKVTGSYRGTRHLQGLPSRGQRTRSNARTKRGKRKTIGAMRKKDLTKFGVAEKNPEEEKVAKEDKEA
ncbi:MAG TPA: 30S ribosomal protein S13 [Patescibacteria group bacterium]|nr:30S ribosomal protein S13 [Patescibacteria group bacterium]